MAKKKSQKLLLAHSKAKVELLGKYLEKYLNIVSNRIGTKKIWLFDLFCGEGQYPNGGKGSPLVILDAIHDLHEKNIANLSEEEFPKITVCFNDTNKSKINKLRSIVNKHKKDYASIEYRSEDYTKIINILPPFLAKRKNSEKVFIFIDPYGYKEIKATHIKELLKSQNSEILLFLPTQFMYRFNDKGTPQALIDFVDELYPKGMGKKSNKWQYIESLKSGFRNFLGNEFFVDSFTIQKDKNTVFCLFFFSSHIRGFEKMLETKWELDKDAGHGWSYESSGNLFSSQKINRLEKQLTSFLEEEKFNGEVYKFVLSKGFLPKHATEVLRELQNKNRNNLLVIETKSSKLARKGSFYINYSNFRNNPKKVSIKLKKWHNQA